MKTPVVAYMTLKDVLVLQSCLLTYHCPKDRPLKSEDSISSAKVCILCETSPSFPPFRGTWDTGPSPQPARQLSSRCRFLRGCGSAAPGSERRDAQPEEARSGNTPRETPPGATRGERRGAPSARAHGTTEASVSRVSNGTRVRSRLPEALTPRPGPRDAAPRPLPRPPLLGARGQRGGARAALAAAAARGLGAFSARRLRALGSAAPAGRHDTRRPARRADT